MNTEAPGADAQAVMLLEAGVADVLKTRLCACASLTGGCRYLCIGIKVKQLCNLVNINISQNTFPLNKPIRAHYGLLS